MPWRFFASIVAPAAMSACRLSTLPLRAARISAVSPVRLSAADRSAFFSMSSVTDFGSPMPAAHRSGVRPFLSVTFTVAPASIRSATVSGVPSAAAHIKGVPSRRSFAFTSLLAASSIFTASALPLSAAMHSGVLPARSFTFTSAPFSSSSGMISTLPSLAAQCRAVRPPALSGAFTFTPLSASSFFSFSTSPLRAAVTSALAARSAGLGPWGARGSPDALTGRRIRQDIDGTFG